MAPSTPLLLTEQPPPRTLAASRTAGQLMEILIALLFQPPPSHFQAGSQGL